MKMKSRINGLLNSSDTAQNGTFGKSSKCKVGSTDLQHLRDG